MHSVRARVCGVVYACGNACVCMLVFMCSEAQGSSFHPFSRQLSISMEGSELLQRQHQRQHNSGYHNLNSSHGNNINFNAGPAVTSSRVAGSSSSASTVESDELLADDQARRRCSSKNLGDITSTGPFLADVSRDR